MLMLMEAVVVAIVMVIVVIVWWAIGYVYWGERIEMAYRAEQSRWAGSRWGDRHNGPKYE